MPKFGEDMLWKQKSWVGGLATDRLLGMHNTFQYAEKVDIRTNPHAILLARESVKDSDSVVVDLVTAMVAVGEFVVAFGDQGNVYRRKIGGVWGTSWVKVLTTSPATGTQAILGAYFYNEYLYFCNNTELWRVDRNTVETSSSWGMPSDELGGSGFASGSSGTGVRPMIEAFNKLYIGDGRYIMEVQDLGAGLLIDDEHLLVQSDEEIVGFTFNGAVIKFYARKYKLSNELGGGSRCYMWNGVDESYNNVVYWGNVNIQSVTGFKGNDYVLVDPYSDSSWSEKPSLYISNGYEFKPLFPFMPQMSRYPFVMTVYKGVVAMGGRSGTLTYGRLSTEFANALNYEFPASPANTYIQIGCVHSQSNVLFQSWKDGSEYGIDIVDDNDNDYAPQGFLVTRIYGGEDFRWKKRLKNLDMVADIPSDDHNVDIYFRKDFQSYKANDRFRYNETWNFGTAVLTMDAGEGVHIKGSNPDDFAAFNEFRALEMKIELNSVNTLTPAVLEILTQFDHVED